MVVERLPADFPRMRNLADKMKGRKGYRDSYVSSHIRQFLARQMREFRSGRSQTEFGMQIDKQQTVVSRLEDPSYGKWTLQTLFDVASKLNVAVIVRFVDFPTFLRFSKDMSLAAIRPAEYNDLAIQELVDEEENAIKGSAINASFKDQDQLGASALNQIKELQGEQQKVALGKAA
jgi:hypothetical protein